MAAPRKWRQLLELLSGLRIPANAGVGKVLASDAEGNATWQLPGEASVAIAYRSAARKVPNNALTSVPVDTVVKDPGGNVSLAKGVYVVPSEGYYSVRASSILLLGALTGTVEFSIAITVNGAEKALGTATQSALANSGLGAVAAGVVFCKKGDEIGFSVYQFDATVGAEREIQKEQPSRNQLSVSRVGEGPVGPENKLVEESIASAYRSTAQKIPSAAFTTIKLDKAIKDPHGLFNLATGAYIVPAEGYYQVNGNSLVKISAAGEYNTVLKIYVNGSPRVAGPFLEKVGKEFIGGAASGIVFCKAGDEITLAVYQASGAEKETFASEEYNQMSICRVGTGPAGPIGPEGKAGGWNALSLTAKLEAAGAESGEPHGARSESGGASARLRGELKAAAEVKVGETMFTVPAGLRPKKEITVLAARGSGAIPITILPAGACLPQLAIAKATLWNLDGITYNLT